jgi:phospholipase C
MKPEHIVVLMFENRSFDHLLGHLSHGGLEPVPSSRLLSSDADVSIDPGHGFEDVVRQLTGAPPPLVYEQITMNGFQDNYAARLPSDGSVPASQIMGCHNAPQLPTLTTLAQEYAVCSRWFPSVPSETWPNRLFAHSATSDGLLHNDYRLYHDRTTFAALGDAGVSWAVYAGDVPQAAVYVDLGDAFKHRFNPLSDFYDDVNDGTLPAYSFIEPNHFVNVDSQHPVHSVMLGDQLLRRVYQALAGNPKVWQSTLLLVTWDEHGGFPDRITPPRTVAPTAGMTADDGFAFDILGVRVPALVISPYVTAGTVDDMVFDHTSIVRTVLENFGIQEHLTARDAQANTVLGLLDLSDPRAPAELPAPPPQIARAVAAEVAPPAVQLDDFQTGLARMVVLLDEHRAPVHPALTPLAATLEPTASPADIDRLIAQFRLEHMGSRTERVQKDERR